MLPLLQMHPQAVPLSNNIDSFPAISYREQGAPHPSAHRHPSGHDYPRGIPIRVSRHRHGPTAPNVPPPTVVLEHQLRRKTPSGTIDAGYDGSPTQSLGGPPPPKQTVLGSFPPAMIPHVQRLQVSHSDICPRGLVDSSQSGYNDAGNWYPQSDFAASQVFQSRGPADGIHAGQLNGPLGVCSPFVRPSEYNVRAFCPPPVSPNENLSLGNNTWPWGPAQWIGGTSNQFGLISLHRNSPAFGYASNGLIGPSHRPGSSAIVSPPAPLLPSNADPTFQPSSAKTIASVGHLPNPQHCSFDRQANFSERALYQAQKCYLDAVAYVQCQKKQSGAKAGAGARQIPHLIYPKPPRPSRATFVASSTPTTPIVWAPNEAHVTAYEQSTTSLVARREHSDVSSRGSFSSNDHLMNIAVSSYRNKTRVNLSAETDGLSRPTLPKSPIDDCKASLSVIQTLCERSDWKWAEGMLVGGCLHYALEQYEDAYRWFCHINTLDPSHVEAITNAAAALYSLGRFDEAEQAWLKALKLQPNHLEAAEHLVGLMHRKRSREAIEIITYLQQQLKYSGKPSSHSICSSINPGFEKAAYQASSGQGSGYSGYAIHASENGRLLALLHAKGTMLYALKSIRAAMEAFEEAVMISIGRPYEGIQDLIRHVHVALSGGGQDRNRLGSSGLSIQPLLLTPDRARHTAQLAFPGTGGDLPGLVQVASGPARRAAIQTTSNALLSLAKILQDAMASGSLASGLLRHISGVGDILILYYLSLSLQESPSTANNVGILLASVPQSAQSSHLTQSMVTHPEVPGLSPGSGLSLALAYYQYGLRIDSKHVHLHTNLGSLLKDVGQLDLAIQMYERAVSCDQNFDIALTNLANAVKDKGRISDAISYYKRAVKSNPNFAEAVCGLFTALNSVCDWRGRGGVILESGKYDRWHVDERGMLIDAWDGGQGCGLAQHVTDIVRLQLDEASRWGLSVLQEKEIAAIAQQLRHACGDSSLLVETLSRWAGKRWEGSRLLRLMDRAGRVLMWKHYRNKYIHGQHNTAAYRRPRPPASLAVPSAPTVLPFHTFTTPLSAKEVRIISQRNALRISSSTFRSPWLSPSVYSPPPPPDPHLNIGYVSSDFNNHPLAHLMQSVFGLHDRTRVRAICYATTPSDGSVYRQQIERETPVFRDVSTWSANQVVDQIIRDEIHVLVNLNGYTRGARNEIFAARPAPIQMSFMGFAGSLGAEWCDYILADSTAIPHCTLRPWRSNVTLEDVLQDGTEEDAEGWVYSENVIFCRETFFCCDHAQSSDPKERRITWEEEEKRRWLMRRELFPNLADDVIILGNFNQLYKVEPTAFRSWLRILARVPKAVLWVLRFPELGEANLRRTAEAWAGTEVASRLIFTDVAPKHQHISRARVCDLFLDTPECNAHTTAADVLWSSTPLLTFPRYPYKMCSRMAASILSGALPKSPEGHRVAEELISSNEQEYEQTAVKLASGLHYDVGAGTYGSGRGRLAEMRRLLWDHKWTCGLFNTKRWVADVETAYEEAWRRWVAGEGGDIYI